MSGCASCGGCFTGSGCSSSTKSDAGTLNENRFRSLLELAAKPQDQPLTADHDHVIPTIIAELTQNVYASQTVLFSVYEQWSLPDFLELAALLYEQQITGALVAWAWEHSQGDLLATLRSDSKERRLLWDHIDEQALVFEVFSNLPEGRAGRVKRA
ncbi:uncharacterized protein BYT42DRAFT_589239 [Radiomyces spectabilis]|uniref:uncharacterized protein n=1 Tax=Radiomyces spectabilis TaxID=64574 RepID=UPI00222055B5|nr:uncharacterized protein BYT42DRAFT_589239 [Radiomyces spectabilis]KAI8365226.1 hypothetical protein BYT42DRAFT_589239 [Radiomyces spectabilis]